MIVVDGTTSARVMPYDRPGILTDDEAYAVTAYLLLGKGIISEEDVMDAQISVIVAEYHVNKRS